MAHWINIYQNNRSVLNDVLMLLYLMMLVTKVHVHESTHTLGPYPGGFEEVHTNYEPPILIVQFYFIVKLNYSYVNIL